MNNERCECGHELRVRHLNGEDILYCDKCGRRQSYRPLPVEPTDELVFDERDMSVIRSQAYHNTEVLQRMGIIGPDELENNVEQSGPKPLTPNPAVDDDPRTLAYDKAVDIASEQELSPHQAIALGVDLGYKAAQALAEETDLTARVEAVT